MTDYAAVMTRRHPGREWELNGDNYGSLKMLDGGSKPSKKSLDDAWPEVEAELAQEPANAKQVRISALAKLAALGFTNDEISALFGG